jgi:hypothetical protein
MLRDGGSKAQSWWATVLARKLAANACIPGTPAWLAFPAGARHTVAGYPAGLCAGTCMTRKQSTHSAFDPEDPEAIRYGTVSAMMSVGVGCV